MTVPAVRSAVPDSGRRANVLLTGATGHLGSHIARRLAPTVNGLALSDLSPEKLEDVAGETEACGGPVITIPADVTEEAAARAAVGEAHERLGGLDVLICAHGTEGPTGPTETLDASAVRRTFEVNVLSLFWLCGAAAEVFKAAVGGRIINMASGAGLAGGACVSAYHASKHAVVGLTRSLARELGPSNIAVHAVCPGFVRSPMVDRIATGLEELGMPGSYESAVPLGRYAEADEIAEVVRYLACDAPDYLTGETLVIDGGLRA